VDLASNQRLVHYQSKMPLAYPVDGPEPVVVVLGAGKGVSDQWELKQLTEQRPGGPITATTGKFQGWYLDVSDEECELTVNQKTVHGRPLILVKKPTTTKKFTKFPVAK
jgi:hypothetical protein